MYPKSHTINNRYRGPMESYKFKTFNNLVYLDLQDINKVLKELEDKFTAINNESLNSQKYNLITNVKLI